MSNLFNLEATWLSGLRGDNTGSNVIQDLSNNVNALSNALTDKTFSAMFQNEVIQNEQNRLNQKQQSIDLAKTSQNRMITLNNSYSARYGAYIKIIMIVVVLFVMFIGLRFLQSSLIFIPSGVMDLIYIIIFSVGFIYALTIYMDIQSRDPVYFDQINLPPPNMPADAASSNLAQIKNANFGNLLGGLQLGTCIGGSCCDGTTTAWDTASQTCKPIASVGTSAGVNSEYFTSYSDSEVDLYGNYR